jgi:hypothetical protein
MGNMNPYDFVRVDWDQPPQRRAASQHDHFAGLSGRIEATLTAETPLFVKRGNTSEFFTINNKPAIAGSSLKGLFRSVVETVAQSCFWFSVEAPPRDFRPCSSLAALCPACRLFGLISQTNKNTLRAGNVGFEDAVCVNRVEHPPIYTAILSSPKPRHTAFYFDDDDIIAGRKFYFHHRADNLLTATGWLPANAAPEKRQNQYLRPLGIGSAFTFAAEFVNVAEDDFAALLYALTLEPEMRHHFGYAKPCGLGTVRIELTKLTLRDVTARYRQGASATEFVGTLLAAEISRRVTPFVDTIPSCTLNDLRHIWRWPPDPNVNYGYPTQAQFKANSDEPISTTPRWQEVR